MILEKFFAATVYHIWHIRHCHINMYALSLSKFQVLKISCAFDSLNDFKLYRNVILCKCSWLKCLQYTVYRIDNNVCMDVGKWNNAIKVHVNLNFMIIKFQQYSFSFIMVHLIINNYLIICDAVTWLKYIYCVKHNQLFQTGICCAVWHKRQSAELIKAEDYS